MKKIAAVERIALFALFALLNFMLYRFLFDLNAYSAGQSNAIMALAIATLAFIGVAVVGLFVTVFSIITKKEKTLAVLDYIVNGGAISNVIFYVVYIGTLLNWDSLYLK